MSFKQVRDYFKLRIKETDSAFSESEEIFNTDTRIVKAKFDKAFTVFTQGLSGTAINQSVTVDTIPVVVKLYFSGHNQTKELAESAKDLANLIRLRAMSRTNLKNQSHIKSITKCDFQEDPYQGNTKDMVITMNFTVSAVFGIDDLTGI